MHPGLEQWGELKTKGKNMRDLEAEYRAVQSPSETSMKQPQHGNQKPSLHPAASSPRKTKPPTDPEALRRALDEERAAEIAMRNAPRRFDRDPGYPNDIPIRMVTNPWLSARLSEQQSVVPGGLQPPTGPRNYQPARRWSNWNEPTNRPSTPQEWNHQQSHHRRQQANQRQRGPQGPRAQQSTRQQWNPHQPHHRRQQASQQQPGPQERGARQYGPSPPKPEQPKQAGNNRSHDHKSRNNQPETNQLVTCQGNQQPQGLAPRDSPSDGEPTTLAPNKQSAEKSCGKKSGKKKKSGDKTGENKSHEKKSKKHRHRDDVTSPPRKLRKKKEGQKQKRNRSKTGQPEETQPREEQVPTAHETDQNEIGQPTNPNAGRPLQLKEEESDTEQLPSLSARFQPMTTDANPETSAETRVDHVPGRWESRPLPTEAHVGEQHGWISTSFEDRPFLRSSSYGTCAFTSPPPAESIPIPQSGGHAPTTPTCAPQLGVDEVPPETSALARAIAQEMTDKLHAMHLSITDQFEAQSREITDQLDKQITQQKRRMIKLKKKTKVLADKIESQTEMLKRHKTWMRKSSRKTAAPSIEKRPRPSRATEEWEYIHAPIVGHSDDSTDENFVLSSSGEEEDDEEEDEEEEGTDEDDHIEAGGTGSVERQAEEDILPSVESRSESGSESDESGSDESGSDAETIESGSPDPRTPPRELKRGRARETPEQGTGPRPAKKRRHGKAKETPVVNPYLDLIAREHEKAQFGVFRVGRCRCFH